MHQNHLAVIVPANDLPRDIKDACTTAWAIAAQCLQPGLGKEYSSFYPANLPSFPLGVVLGRYWPTEFMALYLAAQEEQKKAVHFHMSRFLKNVDIHEAENVLICSMSSGSYSKEQAAHGYWYLRMQHGEIPADCGIYYAALGKGLISRQEERALLGSIERYALCAVVLEVKEAPNEKV